MAERMSSVEDYLIKFMKEAYEPHKLQFLARALYAYMNKKCEECLKDRITCALRPFCPEREYLNILIESGAPEKFLPSFCYHLHKKEVLQYLQGKTTLRRIRDAKLPLEAFIDLTISAKKRKEIIRWINEKNHDKVLNAIVDYLKKLHEQASGALVNGIGIIVSKYYENIILINFEKKLVNINVERDYIRTLDVIKALINLICDNLGLSCTLVSTFGNLFYLQIVFYVNKDIDWNTVKLKISELKRNLKKFVSFVRIISSKKNLMVTLQVSLLKEVSEEQVPGELVKNTFREVFKFKEAIQPIKVEKKVG